MKSFILVNSGLEKVAIKEISELINVKAEIKGSVVEFEAKKKEALGEQSSPVPQKPSVSKDLVKLGLYGQSFRKVLVGLGKNSDLNKIDFSKVDWGDYFWEGSSFKVEVEGAGNKERLRIGKKIGSKVFLSVKKKLGFELKFEMKKPDIVVLVFFDGKNYFVGIDFCGCELDKRHYRVFVNPASFKGDLAYYLVRKSGFIRGERLVVGFVKDGTIAIEAGLFCFGRAVNKGHFTFEKMPTFKKIEVLSLTPRKKGENPTIICGFDSSMMNIRAAKKNAKIAGVAELIELNKFDLDELDVKFSKGEVDRLIFQVTKKDEDKLNEIYYQANYVLRKKGMLLIVCRSGWEITVSDKFKLISEEEIKRGGSSYKVWVMEKK